MSVADIQIRARRTAVHAAQHEGPFAEDFPKSRSPVDFNDEFTGRLPAEKRTFRWQPIGVRMETGSVQ